LERLLIDHLTALRAAGQPAEYVARLRRWAVEETIYRETHVIPALTSLREAGTIETNRDGRINQAHKVRLTSVVP
jgi:hypothetical protein